MSYDAHTTGNGHAPVPTSSGIGAGVRLLVLLGILIGIVQGSFVVAASGFGRVWPAADSVKIKLPPAKLK